MSRQVDVAVIGAGHAGLNAIKEIRKVTDNFVLINGGQLGTTCARIGCMPSKVAVHLADAYDARKRFEKLGIKGAEAIELDVPRAMERVRDLRDMFVDLILANTTDEMGDTLIEGYASFVDARTLRVGDEMIHTKATVIATGASSFVPPEWHALGEGVLTVDTLFDLETLPESVAVLGLGPIGIELGQALHRLGVRVIGVERGETIARIVDPIVNRTAIDIIERDFPLWLGAEATITRQDGGFRVKAGDREAQVEQLLVATGRLPSLDRLGLWHLGVASDGQGVPKYNPLTMQIDDLPIYIAGDAAGGLGTLQQAADQGRVAGYNAARPYASQFKPKTQMSIVFCEPNVATVGAPMTDLGGADTVVGEVRFGPVGRAVIMGRNRGILRIYADKRSGRILGAAMVGTHCEHLAHLLAWAVEQDMTVAEALRMPYYHPVIEEAIQDALHELDRQLDNSESSLVQLECLDAAGLPVPGMHPVGTTAHKPSRVPAGFIFGMKWLERRLK
jgi:dihydrolipoamide dehydrogenase